VAQFVVRNVDEDVKKALRSRARRHGRSLEEEVREILRKTLAPDRSAVERLGARIAARFRGVGLATPVTEQRGHSVRVPDLNR
jgi:plasmid stability protein